jgi:hypothetical protein
LTTLATEKGDSGAEAIALEIGTYMGEVVQEINNKQTKVDEYYLYWFSALK